jgi:FkbM family methyltransferase
VFDIGACEAEDSIRYSRLFPQAAVYAFEPRTDNLAIGKESIARYKADRIVLENIALSNSNGVAEFFLSEGAPEGIETGEWDFGNKSSSLLPPSEEMKKHTSWLKFNKRIEVPTMRLEDYVKSRNIEAIDFAHIDVQGAELMVLEGAGHFLKSIRLIWMEVEAVELYKNQPLKKDVESFMKAHDFENVLDTVNTVAGDQLYANSKYFDAEKINAFKRMIKRNERRKKIASFFKKFR